MLLTKHFQIQTLLTGHFTKLQHSLTVMLWGWSENKYTCSELALHCLLDQTGKWFKKVVLFLSVFEACVILFFSYATQIAVHNQRKSDNLQALTKLAEKSRKMQYGALLMYNLHIPVDATYSIKHLPSLIVSK